MLQPWEIELVAAGEQLDAFRQAYLQQLKPVFEDILAQLVPLEDLTLSYYRGWDREKPLAQVLDEQFERDTQLGYTQAGAQRARSEEHTSELQSRPHLVCRLLLEKKKRKR